MTALVIVPTYNERANLPTLVAGVLAHAGVRMLIVDDQSPDGTGAARRRTGARAIPAVSTSCTARGAGASAARTSTASRRRISEPVDLICQMDADLSHDPAHLPSLMAATAARRCRDRLAVHPGRRDRELAETASRS